ncbi:MAG TPA: TlpA disulfide reductase family protein [Tepidisphaeraceae bacterium]
MRNLTLAAVTVLIFTTAAHAQRTIAQITADVKAVRVADAAQRGPAAEKLDALAREAHALQAGQPAADEAALARSARALFTRAWAQMPWADALGQINAVVAEGRPAYLVPTARSARAGLSVRGLEKGETTFADAKKAVDDLIAADPKDSAAAPALYELSMRAADATERQAIEDRLLKDYAKSGEAARLLDERQQAKEIGKPFDLTFKDFRTGKEISLQRDLKGKIVVIDFWATWCAPCVAAFPELKRQYATYKPQGVEFISVSVDDSPADGGEAALKAYLDANPDLNWLHYYQGNGLESTFSKRWFVNSVPMVFVIDGDGILRANRALGHLDRLLPELIAKRDGAKKPS